MPVKVDLLANGQFIEIRSDGQVTRREIGWATERVRELVQAHEILGILADSKTTQVEHTPAYSSEIIENFLLAMDRPLPIAYVQPDGWGADHLEAVQDTIRDLPAYTQTFDDRRAALTWLEGRTTGRAINS